MIKTRPNCLFLPETDRIMNQNKTNFLIAAVLVVFAVVLKVITYPHSFNPIIAIALFSGAVISDKKLAFAMPLFAMFFSDLIFEIFNIAPGFYGLEQAGNYVALLLVTVFGFGMHKITPVKVAGFSIGASLIFFFLSNSNTFLFDTFNSYESGFAGWTTCMAAGIPFLKIKLLTDLFFSVVLFSSYVLIFRNEVKKAIA